MQLLLDIVQENLYKEKMRLPLVMGQEILFNHQMQLLLEVMQVKIHKDMHLLLLD
jgi:hypothetical protein